MKTLLFEKYIETNMMTMRELASKLGYTPEYLSLIRHGHFPLTESFIARACIRLEQDIGDLFLPDTPEEMGNPHSGDGDHA